MIAEPTFIASLNGLCGFILVVEDGEVDAYAPSGELLGVFHDRIAAVEAVLMRGVHIGRLNHGGREIPQDSKRQPWSAIWAGLAMSPILQ